MLNPAAITNQYSTPNMVEPEKVWPSGIRYGDVNPEGIASEIRLVKFTPQSTLQNAKGGDIVRFQIQNDGFFDPFSAYIRIQVECTPAAGEVRFLDRSAHSFISAMNITSNGVDVERIDRYDEVAAMINDMIYSPEQMSQHHWEGFPSQWDFFDYGQDLATSDAASNQMFSKAYSDLLFPASTQWAPIVGEHAFFGPLDSSSGRDSKFGLPVSMSEQIYYGKLLNDSDTTRPRPLGHRNEITTDFLWHNGCQRGIPIGAVSMRTDVTDVNGQTISASFPLVARNTTREFIIPLYSGFMGVLMPLKKFLPLAYMPLNIEFTLNPHALYSSLTTEEGGRRDYNILRFEIVSHVLHFDSEVRSVLNSTLAQGGLYLHCNSFAMAPPSSTAAGTVSVPPIINIGLTQKSINSVHMIIKYLDYQTNAAARKLHFVSHNIQSLQLRNGTQLIPAEPLTAAIPGGSSGDTYRFSHVSFLVETLKAWGKLHNQATDCLLNAANYGIDALGIQTSGISTPINLTDQYGVTWRNVFYETYGKQATVGRTQYAINMEGEELGEDKSIITGRPAKYPFDIALLSSGKVEENSASEIVVFLRYDFIVQIRPDLLIQVSGR